MDDPESCMARQKSQSMKGGTIAWGIRLEPGTLIDLAARIVSSYSRQDGQMLAAILDLPKSISISHLIPRATL